MAAKMPGDIDDLADEIQAWHALRLHPLRRELPRIDAAQRALGLVVAQRSGGQHRPVVERGANLGEALLAQRSDRTGRLLPATIAQAPLQRKPMRQALREQA